jgi:hypothetical protein
VLGLHFKSGRRLPRKEVLWSATCSIPLRFSLARSLISISEKAGSLWEKVRARLPSRGNGTVSPVIGAEGSSLSAAEVKKWTPFCMPITVITFVVITMTQQDGSDKICWYREGRCS